jgi:hypothetical protein
MSGAKLRPNELGAISGRLVTDVADSPSQFQVDETDAAFRGAIWDKPQLLKMARCADDRLPRDGRGRLVGIHTRPAGCAHGLGAIVIRVPSLYVVIDAACASHQVLTTGEGTPPTVRDFTAIDAVARDGIWRDAMRRNTRVPRQANQVRFPCQRYIYRGSRCRSS